MSTKFRGCPFILCNAQNINKINDFFKIKPNQQNLRKTPTIGAKKRIDILIYILMIDLYIYIYISK
jgi:ribosomal protein L32E